MHPFMRSMCALLLAFVCLPAIAANCPTLDYFAAYERVQTGEMVGLDWSYTGGTPLSQTLTGSDFREPVVIPAGQNFHVYRAMKPGEKHAQLTVVTECGTMTRNVRYFVQQCQIGPAPEVVTSVSEIRPGETFTASVDLPPGHTATWEIYGGTPSATTGSSIQITAGDGEYVAVNVWMMRGKCGSGNGTIVRVIGNCTITEPPMSAPDFVPAGGYFGLYVPPRAGETTTLVPHGAAEVYYNDGVFLDLRAPDSGSFSVDVVVSNGTCTRTFTRTWTVGPCNPTATVTAGAGSGSCGASSAVATFTGTPPFQGWWSDNQYFFTYDNRLERPLTTPGTYTVSSFWDNYCQGTVSGSVTSGASFPQPHFTIDPIVNGWYYSTATCAGLERVARLSVPIPAGAQVEWSVGNGTIVNGQGTSELHFASASEGSVPVTATFRDAQGCSQSYSDPYTYSYGTPRVEMTVEPSTITGGETARITVRHLNPFTGGSNITSSLGDPIAFISGDNGTIVYEYRSGYTGGTATITYTANTPCGDVTTVEGTLTIQPGTPPAATATVRATGTSCDTYMVEAAFTGGPPFRGTVLRDGEFYTSFYTDFPSLSFKPQQAGTYTISEFFDSVGAGTITGSAAFAFDAMPYPEFTFDRAAVCLNGTAVATLTNALPEGASVTWNVYGGSIVSGQGTPSVTFRADNEYVTLSATTSSPNTCSATGWGSIASGSNPMAPMFDLYGVYAGESTSFLVMLDPATETWGFENSMGDPMEILGSPWTNYYVVSYRSTHGAGTSDVRVWSTNSCGITRETTRAMQILPQRATATLTSTPDPVCGAILTVTFTGTPPFTGTWSDTGETFTTYDYTYTRNVGTTSMYLNVSVSDANGPGIGSAWVLVQPTYAPYVNPSGNTSICVGGTGNFTADVPEGWQVIWTIEGSNATIVSGQGTGNLVVQGVTEGQFIINARYRTPGGCEGAGSGFTVNVTSCNTP